MKGMIPMNVKSFLYRVKREMREVQIKQMQIAQIRSSLLPSGIRYDVDKVQTSPSDPMIRVMARIDEMEREIAGDFEQMQADFSDARKMIESLEDSRERSVLTLYFLTPGVERMDDVSCMISYSRSRTYEIYNNAINHLSEMKVRTESDTQT